MVTEKIHFEKICLAVPTNPMHGVSWNMVWG